MGALAHLSESTVNVEPGRSATITITVRNTGTVVDRFGFEALGSAASWVTFTPESLSLFPDASGDVNVVFSPRRDPSVAAGPTPFAVRVTAAEDPAGTVVEEGTVNVGAFSDIEVELIPRVTSGRLMGRARVAVDNRSNCGYRAELSGTDPKAALAFSFRPSVIDVAPGNAAFAKIAIRPKSRFWRGIPRTHPIQVLLRMDGAEPAAPAAAAAVAPASRPGGAAPSTGASPPRPDASGGVPGGAASGAEASSAAVPPRAPSPHKPELSADGTMLQEPLLPRWLLAAASALVALAVLLLILWFALVKPQIHSTAQSEVGKQLAASGIAPTASSPSSPSGSGGGSSKSGGGSSGSGGGGTSAVTSGAAASGSSPASAGVTVNGSIVAGGNGTRSYTVPAGRTLEITDLLVQNSAGNNGNLALERNGTVLMQWAMANFRDIDYHWITPTLFNPGTQVQLVVSGCTGACNPGVYYAGRLVP